MATVPAQPEYWVSTDVVPPPNAETERSVDHDDPPLIGVVNPDADVAVETFTAGLQAGHDGRDALMLDDDGQPAPPMAEPDRPFSEMAMYVLVRREGQWWLAAGQNTPMRPGGAVPPVTGAPPAGQ